MAGRWKPAWRITRRDWCLIRNCRKLQFLWERKNNKNFLRRIYLKFRLHTGVVFLLVSVHDSSVLLPWLCSFRPVMMLLQFFWPTHSMRQDPEQEQKDDSRPEVQPGSSRGTEETIKGPREMDPNESRIQKLENRQVFLLKMKHFRNLGEDQHSTAESEFKNWFIHFVLLLFLICQPKIRERNKENRP